MHLPSGAANRLDPSRNPPQSLRGLEIASWGLRNTWR